MNLKKIFVNTRVVEAEDIVDAIDNVSDGLFLSDHPLCDAINELNKDIFILSLPELSDLVELMIKKKFWSVVELGTKTTEQLILEHFNK